MASANRNYYQLSFTAEGKRRFQAAPRDAVLMEEIALLRTRIRGLAELTEPDQEPSIQLQRLLLQAIDLLSRLVRVQSQLQPDQEDLLGELNEEVLRKLESYE